MDEVVGTRGMGWWPYNLDLRDHADEHAEIAAMAKAMKLVAPRELRLEKRRSKLHHSRGVLLVHRGMGDLFGEDRQVEFGRVGHDDR